MSESMLDNWTGEKNLEAKEANIGFEHRSTRFRLNIVTTGTTARLLMSGHTNLYKSILMDTCHPRGGWGGLRLLVHMVARNLFTCIKGHKLSIFLF